MGRDRCHRTGCVGWVDVSCIGGQWEAWQSHCQFLMGSLCFDMWLAHSDGTIIQDYEADFKSGSQCVIHITQRSVSLSRVGAESSPGCLTRHLMTQLSQVGGLKPSCPTIFAALCFLQRSETGQRTVGPRRATANWVFRDARRGSGQRGYHGHLSSARLTTLPRRSVLIA